jgi:glycosyltransferase involved in cell wall biosynthesis
LPDLSAPKPLVTLLIPCFNEGAGVLALHGALDAALADLPGHGFELLFVDDGSTDDTLARLLALAATDARVRVVELSRNFGKEAALSAGLDAARGDAVIPLDADGQDPPELIGRMLACWREGFEVVLARRVNREADPWLKRTSAGLFYAVHNAISTVQIPDNVGDFRLMDRVVVEAVRRLPERQRFMKGLFTWVGFRQTTLDYVRPARTQGATKFSALRLWNFALEGVTSFSVVPLKAWTYVGLAGAMFTTAYAVFIFGRVLLYGIDVPGYASLLVTMLFLGSLQLIGVGVLGEYIGRIYMEAKQRPVYVVRRIHEADDGA